MIAYDLSIRFEFLHTSMHSLSLIGRIPPWLCAELVNSWSLAIVWARSGWVYWKWTYKYSRRQWIKLARWSYQVLNVYILNDKFFVHQRNGRQLNNARSATFHRSFIDFLVFIGKLISSGRDPHLYVILTLPESCGVARHCLWDIFRTQNSWCSVYILFIESTYIFYRPSIFCISRLICYF